MKRYIVKLIEPYNNNTYHELRDLGADVIWISKLLPKMIAVESGTDLFVLRSSELIEDIYEESIGSFNTK